MALRWVSGLALIAGFVSSAAPATPAAPPPPAAPPSAPVAAAVSPALVLQACRRFGLVHGVRCGRLMRPLDPAHPGLGSIGLEVLVVPALARDKRPDPVFFLAGGPGQGAIDLAPQLMPAFSRLNNRHDIVFVDQRGTGRSTPLDCPDDPAAERPDEGSVAAQRASMQRCRAALVARPGLGAPGALGFFTTAVAAQDLDAVRRALGAAQVDLVGVSYGTRLALEVMRRYPDTVRRAVLDSVAPPDMALPASFSTDAQAALDRMFADCASEPACHAAFPALRGDWQRLLARLPLASRSADPRTGRILARRLTREQLLSTVRGALYAPFVASALPAAIDAAAHGRFEGLDGLDALLSPRQGPKLALGLHFSVVCAEDLPQLDRPGGSALANPPGADFGGSSVALYRQVCAEWPRGEVPAAFAELRPSPVPSLLLAGELDPATPPRHARRVAQALGSTAQLVVVPHAGHNLLAVGCAPDLMFRFIDAAGAGAVDASCLQKVPRPPAFLPPGAPR